MRPDAKSPPTGVVEAVYDELRGLAAAFMRHERPDHTLQATAVVHEALLRLQVQGSLSGAERNQFFALAALMIRRVLVDHARRHGALRRGGGHRRQMLGEGRGEIGRFDVLAFDEALAKLETMDPRKAQIVQLRFFGGLTADQVADLLDVSPRTVAQEWALSKAWLRRELCNDGAVS